MLFEDGKQRVDIQNDIKDQQKGTPPKPSNLRWKHYLGRVKLGVRRALIRLDQFTESIGSRLGPLPEYWRKIPKHPRAILKYGLIAGGSLFMLVWCFYLSVLFGAFGKLPSVASLRKVKNPVASEVYAADGSLLGRYYLENRTNKDFEDLPPYLINALVSTEDARFYRHDGVDIRSLFRVIIKSLLLQNESSGGGSTISQQLSKNLYPRKRYRILSLPVNKVKEIITAIRLERVYSKNQILELYLNTVPFGENVYGIEAASKRFFSVAPDSLKIEEAAVLVGLLKATTTYNPKLHPERSQGRRDQVFEQMVRYGNLSQIDADSLKTIPLSLKYNLITPSDGPAPYFREHLRQFMHKWAKYNTREDGSAFNIYEDGLKIYTTIDPNLQQAAQEAVYEHMKDLQSTFNNHWKDQKPWGKRARMIEKAVANSERYKNLKAKGYTQEQLNANFKNKVDMTIFTYEGEKQVQMSPLDSIIHYLMFLNTGFMVMEPNSGHIKAWVGGINHKYFKYDHVLSERQVGSTFKPIVYATALERGIMPCDTFGNDLIKYPEYEDWEPGNSDGKYGGHYSMRGALAKSVNTVAVQVGLQTGIDRIVKMARELGIEEADLPVVPSITLGTAEVSLYEMMKVYGTFANHGYQVEPVFLDRIEDSNGQLIEDFQIRFAQEKQVLHPADADLLRNMMQAVVDSGTARRLRWKYDLRNDIAGKTGTTQSHADGWFMGFTPQFVGGVWVGGSNPKIRFRTTNLGQGANMALPIWAKFHQKMNKLE
ncbi:MAG: transglycosylase domain-containing protein, partial [Bacteroidota bacterium]